MRTRALIACIVTGIATTASATSAGQPSNAASSATSSASATSAVIIDVRTPGEFAENHLQEALNIDFRDASFETKIKALDKKQRYQLYCRTGNRSGQAAKLMQTLGFKSVENLGSLQEASARLKKSCAIKPTC